MMTRILRTGHWPALLRQPAWRRLLVTNRIAAALLGGYWLVWGLTQAGIALQVVLGVAFDEATLAMYLIAFLIYVWVFFWSFITPHALRCWGILLISGAVATALAAGLQWIYLR